MSKTPLHLGLTGQNDALEPAVARALLAWLCGLTSCATHEDLGRLAALSNRTLGRFVTGQAGNGGYKALGNLLEGLKVPPALVFDLMLPTLRAVHRIGRAGTAAEALLEVAPRVAWLELLVRQGEAPGGGTRKTCAGLHPADARVLIDWLQTLGGWSRRDLASRAGCSHEALRQYAAGAWSLPKPVALQLVAGAGLPAWLGGGLLLPVLRAVRLALAHHREGKTLRGWGPFGATPGAAGPLAVDLRGTAVAVPAEADRAAAEALWQTLQGLCASARVRRVKARPEYHSWALVERVCTASREAATESARTALRLARLALRVARLAQVEPLFALQLEGFARLHIANARRVGGRPQQAAALFARGLLFWEAGAATRHPLLPGWRVLDLEASLRRSLGHFPAALDLLDRARDAAPQAAWGRILFSKATVHSRQGDHEAAVAALEEAAQYYAPRHDPGLAFLCRCLMGAALCHLGRHRAAADLMPGTWELAATQGGALDHLRLEGLRGRIAAGLGEREEALAAFSAVREEFHRLRMAFDYALLSLEAAELLLQDKRFDEVQALALEMEWIFNQEGIPEEAEKALDLFRQAAEGRSATPELAGQVVRFLYQAQHDPEVQFAA